MNECDIELLSIIKIPKTKEKGFRMLIEKYQKQIYGIIRKMVIIHEDTDDLTQNTFIKAFKYIDKFEGNSSLSTWLYRIAYNESLDFLNWKKQKQFFRVEDYQSQMMHSLNQQELDGDQISMILKRSLDQLPPKQRMVFNMKYFDNLSYEEMSEITETSIGSLKASYHLAVKKIKKFIDLN
jgi:RNA polymerase sigma-70 factor (ECF subfamily)